MLTKYADNVGLRERQQHNRVYPKKNNWQEQFNSDKCTQMEKNWKYKLGH